MKRRPGEVIAFGPIDFDDEQETATAAGQGSGAIGAPREDPADLPELPARIIRRRGRRRRCCAPNMPCCACALAAA